MENESHSKLLTTKIIINTLQSFQQARIQSSFDEVKIYSKFDNHCVQKLKSLGQLMSRLGEQKLRQSLNTWYHSTLKPYDTIL